MLQRGFTLIELLVVVAIIGNSAKENVLKIITTKLKSYSLL